ncbi:hypothetical protein [Tumebacillus lipolyticus]|uniref:Uncharacterized protein n=1 Tax=Tumebacillus lipolyticus TaxID=1280370 RepID=A0ABW5A1W7_9BACL
MKKLFKLGMVIVVIAVSVVAFSPNASNSSKVASTAPPDLNFIVKPTVWS